MTSRAWCFTCFNWYGEFTQTWEQHSENIKFAVCQLEFCPETERLHIQGYVEFKNAVRRGGCTTWLTQAVGENSHVERRRGTREEAIQYCEDDSKRPRGNHAGPWYINHEARNVGQGARTDLSDFLGIIETRGLDDAIEANPATYVRYARGISAYVSHLLRQRFGRIFRRVDVCVLWGEAGVGKTRCVYGRTEFHVYRLFSMSPEWWDHYAGEDAILLDDFYGQIPIGRMLHILDGHPLIIPYKGGSTYAGYTKVYITSNKPPAEWYPGVEHSNPRVWRAFQRRITTVQEVRRIEPQGNVAEGFELQAM